MALSFKGAEAHSLARQVARLTGETLVGRVRQSIAERLARQRLGRGYPAKLADELAAILQRMDALPDRHVRRTDEIVRYDETGLPR